MFKHITTTHIEGEREREGESEVKLSTSVNQYRYIDIYKFISMKKNNKKTKQQQ